jgi:hypothetical protein
VSLAYYLLMATATSYPVIPFPKEVHEPDITFEHDGAHIVLDTLPRWKDYLRLLEEQRWRECTFEVCGFIHVTDTSFQATYYYGQDPSPPILQLYSGVWFSGGAYMNLYNSRCTSHPSRRRTIPGQHRGRTVIAWLTLPLSHDMVSSSSGLQHRQVYHATSQALAACHQ